MLKPATLALTLLILGGCMLQDEATGPWRSLGLDGLRVWEIEFREGLLWVATDDGMYSADPAKSRIRWKAYGLQGKRVEDFVWLSDGSLLAGIHTDGGPSGETTLYKRSVISGEWTPFRSNYGGPKGYTRVAALENLSTGPDTIYARGSANVSRSTDGAASWTSIWFDWRNFDYQSPLLYIDPYHAGMIWAGGESGFFQPYLLRSSDYGKTWIDVSMFVSGDNACYSMVSHPENPSEILVGMEGRILYSADAGETWEERFKPESYPYFHAMKLMREGAVTRVYTSGSENGTGHGLLTFYQSDDFGKTWTSTVYKEGPKELSVKDLEVVTTRPPRTIYFATSQGVFAYEQDSP